MECLRIVRLTSECQPCRRERERRPLFGPQVGAGKWCVSEVSASAVAAQCTAQLCRELAKLSLEAPSSFHVADYAAACHPGFWLLMRAWLAPLPALQRPSCGASRKLSSLRRSRRRAWGCMSGGERQRRRWR
jgi:hypothetical protein